MPVGLVSRRQKQDFVSGLHHLLSKAKGPQRAIEPCQNQKQQVERSYFSVSRFMNLNTPT